MCSLKMYTVVLYYAQVPGTVLYATPLAEVSTLVILPPTDHQFADPTRHLLSPITDIGALYSLASASPRRASIMFGRTTRTSERYGK